MAETVKVWPEWKIVRKLGEGGFGKVYEIMRDSYSIVERRALKIISIPSDDSDIKRVMSEGMDKTTAKEYYNSLANEFIREIAFLSELRSAANIVTYDDYKVVERENGFGYEIYIMMELLTPLTDVLAERSLSEEEVIRLGSDICDALTLCHNKKILHRDIKPDNIFVTSEGVYKLGDFGIARTVEKTAAHTRIGTNTYMAPETYRGQDYDLRADLYSLGVLLYRLLNDNRNPFLPSYPEPVTVKDQEEAFSKRMFGDELPPPAHGSDGLRRAVLKACSFHASDRFASAEEMKAAINGNPSPRPAYKKSRRRFDNEDEYSDPDSSVDSYLEEEDTDHTRLADEDEYYDPDSFRRDYSNDSDPDRTRCADDDGYDEPDHSGRELSYKNGDPDRTRYADDGYDEPDHSGRELSYKNGDPDRTRYADEEIPEKPPVRRQQNVNYIKKGFDSSPDDVESYGSDGRRRLQGDQRGYRRDQVRRQPARDSSGFNAGIAVIITLIVLVIIGGTVTVIALLNRKSDVEVEEDVSFTEAAQAPTHEVIRPQKDFSFVLNVNYDFDSEVPVQGYLDGVASSDVQYISDSGSFNFTIGASKDSEFVVHIDGSEYYRCTLDYDSGEVVNEVYNPDFYSSHIIYY